MPTMATVTITVEVTDEEELFKAAAARAEECGLLADSWDDMCATDGKIRASLIMLFDPGTSPPGVEIQDSEASIIED